ARYTKGDLDSAVIDFHHLIFYFPFDPDGFVGRATLYLEMEEYEKALTDLDRAVDLDPKTKEAFYYRGLVKNKLKDKTAACADFTEALALGEERAGPLLKKTCGV